MLTAKEAAEMAGPSPQDYISFIEPKIKAAAIKAQRQIIIRDEPYCRWRYDSKNASQSAKEAMQILENNGYTLECYYKEMSIAVDLGLVIKW